MNTRNLKSPSLLALLLLPALPAMARPPAPEPHPVKGDFQVGCYYFPGWHRYGAWKMINDWPLRKPLLGYYREGDPNVADWHIAWAVEHGIDFFIYDWYWQSGRRQLEHGLHDGYLKSRFKDKLGFCLLWANHNAPGTTTLDDLGAVADFWAANYFRDPQYVKIDGRPVVVIFSPHRIAEDLKGVEGAKKGLDAIRERVKADGLPGIYLIACAHPSHDIGSLLAEGYDAVSGYNYHELGSKKGEATSQVDYGDMVGRYEQAWKTIRGKGADYIPVAEAGWDPRPWHGPAPKVVHTGKHPAKFKAMLERAKAFVEEAPPKNRAKTVFIEAWNEFAEGDTIEPQREFGFAYLDAVRAVFRPDAGPHADALPGGDGLASDDFHPQTKWTFDRDGDTECWQGQNVGGLTTKGGALVAKSTTADPALIYNDLDVDAAAMKTLTIRMRVDKGTSGRVWWAKQHFAAGAPVRFPIQADGQWHDYTIDLGASPAWKDAVSLLQLAPTDAAGAMVGVEGVEVR